MTKKVFFGQNDLRFFYLKYKDSVYYSISIFVLVIVTCLLLIINLIIPQMQKYLSIRNSVIDQRAKIKNINDNITFITNLNKTQLDSQLQTATKALPPEQDISGVLNAIAASAVRAGVTIGDYNFSLGETEQVSTNQVALQSTQPMQSISVVLTVDGDPARLERFLTEISEKMPLSEVISLDSRDNKTTINLKFYYKIFSNITFKEDVPLSPLSPDKKQLVDKLSMWETAPVETDPFSPASTSSAVPLFE